MGRRLLVQRETATKKEIIDRKLDVGTGTFFSNIVMYFIILSCALTLHGPWHKLEASRRSAQAACGDSCLHVFHDRLVWRGYASDSDAFPLLHSCLSEN